MTDSFPDYDDDWPRVWTTGNDPPCCRTYTDPCSSEDPHRHFERCRGCCFEDRLGLDGWSARSVWGYDRAVDSFYAQLWRHGICSRSPLVSLAGFSPTYRWPGVLALAIIDATEAPPLEVVKAMAILNPSPHLRPLDEIAGKLSAPPGVSEDYKNGYRHALRWVVGESDKCPGSRTESTGGVPSPELVDAEYQLVVGHFYSEELKALLNQQFNAGGERALWWALGGNDARRGRSPDPAPEDSGP